MTSLQAALNFLRDASGVKRTARKQQKAKGSGASVNPPRSRKEAITDLLDAHKASRKRRKQGESESCPACACGSTDGFFRWNGGVIKTTYVCMGCGLEQNALTMGFDALTIKITASPVKYRDR